MPRTLHIKHPCDARWEEMTGTNARRFCAHCQKDVVALAAFTRDEAEHLLNSAKPGSLCLRIEHAEEGEVVLRDESSDASSPARPAVFPAAHRSGSALRVAVGASLLVAACRSEPQPSPDVTPMPAASAAPIERAPVASAAQPTPAESVVSVPPAQPPAAASACDPATAASIAKKTGQKVVMGCVCKPGDALCSCL